VEAQAVELGGYSARFEASQCMRGLTIFNNQIIILSRQDFAGGWSFGSSVIFHCGGTNRFIWWGPRSNDSTHRGNKLPSRSEGRSRAAKVNANCCVRVER
jgi:hypothetical protein